MIDRSKEESDLAATAPIGLPISFRKKSFARQSMNSWPCRTLRFSSNLLVKGN
jgi:hypothetical protein